MIFGVALRHLKTMSPLWVPAADADQAVERAQLYMKQKTGEDWTLEGVREVPEHTNVIVAYQTDAGVRVDGWAEIHANTPKRWKASRARIAKAAIDYHGRTAVVCAQHDFDYDDGPEPIVNDNYQTSAGLRAERARAAAAAAQEAKPAPAAPPPAPEPAPVPPTSGFEPTPDPGFGQTVPAPLDAPDFTPSDDED